MTFKTRRDQNGTGNTLDLLLTTHPSLLTNVRPSAGISDHCIILAEMSNKVRLSSKPPRNVPLWRKVENEDLKQKTAGIRDNFFAETPDKKSVEEKRTLATQCS